MRPRHSVILVAHDRRSYLMKAVESVLYQRGLSGPPELLVVKNFVDEEVDLRLDRLGVKSVCCVSREKGRKVARGIAETRSPLISILDDDDFYEPDRLAVVEEEFDLNRNLVFYHNGHALVNASGQRLQGKGLRRTRLVRRARRVGRLVVRDGRKQRSLARLLRYGADINDSSITVRRDLVGKAVEYLSRVNITTDLLFFVAAMTFEGDVMIDSRELTDYRIHTEMSSLAESPSPPGRFDQEWHSDVRTTVDMVSRAGIVWLERHLELMLVRHTLHMMLKDEGIGSSKVYETAVEMLRTAGVERLDAVTLGELLMTAPRLLAPKTATRVYRLANSLISGSVDT